MRKNIIVIIITLMSISSCGPNNEENKTNNKNMLLAQEVSASCITVIDNPNTPEWTNGFNRLEFFKTVYDKAMTGNPLVYGHSDLRETLDRKVFSPEEIEERMISHTGDLNLHLLKEIWSLEKWNFDEANLKFSKDVTAWVAIRVWEEDGKTKRAQTFHAYPENQKKGELVAESIFYNNIWRQEYPNIYTGFDQINFLKQIVNGIKSGKIDAYDPIYMVDKSKRKFTVEELKKYIDQDFESVNLDFLMHSILFEEDWYFEENTLGITKDVKSIAFVAYKPEINGELSKKILFFIFPK